MATKTVSIAMQQTSEEILNLLNVVRALVTDVEKFDWKTYYEQRSTGEVFSTKFYKYEKSTSSSGEKLNDSKGLIAKPSTETVQNQDDFAKRNAFSVVDCNFIISDDEKKTVTALSGDNNYRSKGAVDCGVMVPMTYWGWEDADDYYIVHFSDRPNAELGCTTPTPWCDEELGYGIVTKYYAGTVNGLPYSSSGNAILNFVSAQSGNTELQKRGTGYRGSGSERIAYLLCMMWIKYATKNIQTVFKGNSDNNIQVKVAEAGESANYVVLTTANADKFYVGETVSIGDPTTNTNLDRGQSYMRNIADKVQITKIEPISGTSNSKVYVNKTGMTITATTYISTMPLHSGTTDNVLGTDGYVANDEKHAFKIGGIEEGIGAYFISMNELWNKTTATTVDYYVRPKGTAWSATASGWSKVGTLNLNGDSSDCWIGDVTVDLDTGVTIMRVKGSGDGVGYGDRQYNGGTGTGWREALRIGSLWNGSRWGFACAFLGSGVAGTDWFCALCI